MNFSRPFEGPVPATADYLVSSTDSAHTGAEPCSGALQSPELASQLPGGSAFGELTP